MSVPVSQRKTSPLEWVTQASLIRTDRLYRTLSSRIETHSNQCD